MTQETSSMLAAKDIWQSVEQINSFPVIQSMVASASPISVSLNGMGKILGYLDAVKQAAVGRDENAGSANGQVSVNFRDIDAKYSFNMFKVIKPKIIFSRYTSRVIPDQMNSTMQTTYYPQVQFKIDYDACCVGSMMLLFTMDIEVNPIVDQTKVQINGYSAKGVDNNSGIEVSGSDINDIQFSYCTDFVFNYIDKISLGFCNTGGNTPIWHQEVPIEIAKIFFALIEEPGKGVTAKRLLRESCYLPGQHPFHQYGDYSFHIKADNQIIGPTTQEKMTYNRNKVTSGNRGFNEIGMYWMDNKIKTIDFQDEYDNPDANLTNFAVGVGAVPQLSNNFVTTDGEPNSVKQLVGFDLDTISGLKYGSSDMEYGYSFKVTPQADGIVAIKNINKEAVTAQQETILSGDTDMYLQHDTNTITVTSEFGGNKVINQTEYDVDKSFTYDLNKNMEMLSGIPIGLITTTNENWEYTELFNYVRKHESQLPKISVTMHGELKGTDPIVGGVNFTENYVFCPYVFIPVGNGVEVQEQLYQVRTALIMYYECKAYPNYEFISGNKCQFEIAQLNKADAAVNQKTAAGVAIFQPTVVELIKNDGEDADSAIVGFNQLAGYYAGGCRVEQMEKQLTYFQKAKDVSYRSSEVYAANGLIPKKQLKDAAVSGNFTIQSNFTFDCKSTNSISKTLGTLSQQVNEYLFSATGAVSPYLNVGNLRYMEVEVNTYKQNDFMINGLEFYYVNQKQSDNRNAYQNRQPDAQNADANFSMWRENAAMLMNKSSEEFTPAMNNPDYMDIHCPRGYHGIVDFYLPLSFLFICQGLKNVYPHYATASQSIVVKFEFHNPLAFVNTHISVKPRAIDPLDFGCGERIFTNRISANKHLTSNISNMHFVLFYNRYVWIPAMVAIIAGYRFYSWITKNYERFVKVINVGTPSLTTLQQFQRSVFYTKMWVFITNTDTVNVIQNRGSPTQLLPLYVNRYDLPLFDVMTYNFQTNTSGNVMTGSDFNNFSKQFNSVYSLTPVDFFQLNTHTEIQMSDKIPARLEMFTDYMMLDHAQLHQPFMFNNLYPFNIDPIWYQDGAPNCNYSPAYAPSFKIEYQPKSYTCGATQYGAIVISECINITYIANHVCLLKYETSS